MSRRPQSSSASRVRKVKVLDRLSSAEAAGVLRSLLGRHPELTAEAEELARAALTDVDAGNAARKMLEEAVEPKPTSRRR